MNKNQIDCIEYLLTTTMSKKEIADRLNISERTIYNWLNDIDFQFEMGAKKKILDNEFKLKIRQNIKDLVLDSVNVLQDILKGQEYPNLKVRIALEMIDKYSDLLQSFGRADMFLTKDQALDQVLLDRQNNKGLSIKW